MITQFIIGSGLFHRRGGNFWLFAALFICFVGCDIGSEPRVRGRTLDQWLKDLGAQSEDSVQALQIKIHSSPNPTVVNLEVDLSYDALVRHEIVGSRNGSNGKFIVVIDGRDTLGECKRSPRNSCLFEWYPQMATPGRHTAQARLIIGGRSGTRPLEAQGLTVTLESTNKIHLDPFFSEFDYKGVHFIAKLDEIFAKYQILIEDLNGKKIESIIGSTTNGEIKRHWDLAMENGQRFDGRSFRAEFMVEFTNSAALSAHQIYHRIK